MAAVGAMPVGAPARATEVDLVSHRAIYDLRLAESRKTGLQAVRGRILYDFSGSHCEGYTTHVRQVSELQSAERPDVLSDLRSTTWEDGAGMRFRFRSSNYINESLSTAIDGEAERTAAGVQVVLKQPVQKTFRLDSATVFPTAQMREVIRAAQAGRRLLELPVFDGSENGEKVYNTLTVIGQPIAPSVQPDDAGGQEQGLAGLVRWPVRVSYFEKGGSGEQTPIYSIAFELYANGVSRALSLDYNEFVIEGRLVSIALRETAACPAPPR
jgi:hypothetical protein